MTQGSAERSKTRRKTSKKSTTRSTRHRGPGRPRLHTRKTTTIVRRHVKKAPSGKDLSTKTVVELRRLASSMGLPQSRKGKVYKKSSLVKAIAGHHGGVRRRHRS